MYPPAPPVKPSSNKAVKILIVVLIFVVAPCVGLGFFMFKIGQQAIQVVTKTLGPSLSCAANFQYARDATIEYAKANGDKLPSAANWQTEIEPYYRKLASNIPSEIKKAEQIGLKYTPFEKGGEWKCSGGSGPGTGISFNKDLAGKILSSLKEPEKTVMFFEVEKPGKNLSTKYEILPGSKAPEIFGGERRNWIKVHVVGGDPLKEVDASFESSTKSGTKFQVSPDGEK